MIIEYIRYTISADRQSDFVKAYALASKQLDDSQYCLGYELSQCEEEPESFILRIEWTSTEDHLTGFRRSKDFATFLNHVRPFFNNISEMNHYKLTEVITNK